MRIFLDFEASSLAKHSYPIEVAWVGEDGVGESWLIRPADDWTDWSDEAAGIHGIARETLLAEGHPPETVAARMIERLSGHDLLASAPSWDGKWLSALLRAGGQPRHALRLRDTEEAQRESVEAILAQAVLPDELPAVTEALLAEVRARFTGRPAHRALADAERELAIWRAAIDAADARIATSA